MRPLSGRHDQRREAEPVDGADRALGDRVGDVLGRLVGAGEEPLAVAQVGLGRARDLVHHLDRLDRVIADRGLLGEHHRVGAVVDRVGDVGHLGPGRPPGVDHRGEHLGRGDRRLRALAGFADHPLLDDRHLRQRQLDAEVAAGDHDPAARRADDLGDVVGGLALLDLRDHAGCSSRARAGGRRPGRGRRPWRRRRRRAGRARARPRTRPSRGRRRSRRGRSRRGCSSPCGRRGCRRPRPRSRRRRRRSRRPAAGSRRRRGRRVRPRAARSSPASRPGSFPRRPRSRAGSASRACRSRARRRRRASRRSAASARAGRRAPRPRDRPARRRRGSPRSCPRGARDRRGRS